MTNPLDYRITSPFGNRTQIDINKDGRFDTPKFHDGVDFAMPQGTPVTLPPGGDWDGVVTYAGLDQYGGAYVDIKSNKDGGVARFLHLSRIDVKKGDSVTSNQQLGLSGGAKGTWGAGLSTGPHLHIGLFSPDRRFVDPLPWLQKAYVKTLKSQSTIINPNELSMNEKKQLDDYVTKHQATIASPEFAKLQKDEQQAITAGGAIDTTYLIARINGLREDLKKANAAQSVTTQSIVSSTEKKPWESKKFWSLVLGGVGIIVAQTNPDLKPVVDELTLTLTTYLAGQSVIDTVNTLKK